MWFKTDEERMKYKEWLAALKAGDTVAIKGSSRWGVASIEVTKIQKVTPTGMFRLENGELAKPDGVIRGEYNNIEPYTEEIQKSIEIGKLRKQAQDIVYSLYRESLYKNMTNEELNAFVATMTPIVERVKS